MNGIKDLIHIMSLNVTIPISISNTVPKIIIIVFTGRKTLSEEYQPLIVEIADVVPLVISTSENKLNGDKITVIIPNNNNKIPFVII